MHSLNSLWPTLSTRQKTYLCVVLGIAGLVLAGLLLYAVFNLGVMSVIFTPMVIWYMKKQVFDFQVASMKKEGKPLKKGFFSKAFAFSGRK